MVIGVPKEIKDNESRVAIQPSGVNMLSNSGHEVLIQSGAGLGSGFTDSDYSDCGAIIVPNSLDIFSNSELILKVKEPQPEEVSLIKEGQIIFTYFHFASSKVLTDAMIATKSTAIAYETVQNDNDELPLLTPMSEVAGRMAVQNGAKCLEISFGGKGKLLSGVPGVKPGVVTIIGAGIVGMNAAKLAAGMGAHVNILDIDLNKLKYIDDIMPDNVTTIYSDRHAINELLPITDLLIGAVLVVGDRAPKLITKDMLKLMQPKSVIVDVAVDQGGCVETCKPTTHKNPTYEVNGITHYCVANMPGAVPYTSTKALSNATFKYVKIIADNGLEIALVENHDLMKGLNMHQGIITHSGLSNAFGYNYLAPREIFSTQAL